MTKTKKSHADIQRAYRERQKEKIMKLHWRKKDNDGYGDAVREG